MRNKIASQFAVGVILLIAILIAGIFWLDNKKQQLQSNWNQQKPLTIQSVNVTSDPEKKKEFANKNSNEATCVPHYYDGDATIQGWPVDSVADNNELTIQIKNQDIEKLPTTKADSLQPQFTLTLIDPTEKNREQLKNATEKNPASLTIHGYAQLCKSSPRISVQQATIAFRKS